MGKNKKKPEKISYMTPRNKLYCYFPGRVKEQTVEENKALYEELKNKNTNGIHSAADTMTELREPPDSTEEDDAEDIREFIAHNAKYMPFVTCQYEDPNDDRILIGNDFSIYLALWDEEYVEELTTYIKNIITCSNDKRFIDILDPLYLETVLSI